MHSMRVCCAPTRLRELQDAKAVLPERRACQAGQGVRRQHSAGVGAAQRQQRLQLGLAAAQAALQGGRCSWQGRQGSRE